MRPTIPLFALLLSACASLPAGGDDCPPPPEDEIADSSEEPVSIQPGDYRVVAVSSQGQKDVGLLRLWRSSPADSGRSPNADEWEHVAPGDYTGEWVHVAPGDTVEHPMIGVTDVDFFIYTAHHEMVDIEKLDYPPNPVYPQVLLYRRAGEPVSWTTKLTLLIDTIADRHLGGGLDGLGTGLRISSAGPGFFRGTYDPWGVAVVPPAGEGHYCAWLIRPR